MSNINTKDQKEYHLKVNTIAYHRRIVFNISIESILLTNINWKNISKFIYLYYYSKKLLKIIKN